MKENAERTNSWLWLTMTIAVLMAIAAGTGLFIDGIYSASPNFVARHAAGQDLVTLVIALPILIISAILIRRGSMRALLIRLGVLVYLVYSYIMTSLVVSFNPLFIVYVALLGCSTYALIADFLAADLSGIKAQFTEKTPIKTVSTFFMVFVAFFSWIWLREIVPAYIEGIPPLMATLTETPTGFFYAVDMAWLFPSIVLAGIWLWRKRAIGYTLTGTLLMFSTIFGLAVSAQMAFTGRYSDPYPIYPAIFIWVFFSAVLLGILIWFLRGLRKN